jgi:hypothetical protein
MYRTIRLLVITLGTFVVLTSLSLPASAQAPVANERSVTYDLPASHQIRMDLAAGEYTVQNSPDAQIHVRWSSVDPKESLDNLKVSFTNNRGRAEIGTKHAKAMKVIVQVPSPSDLRIRLAFGELRLVAVEGNKDISMSAGEIHVQVDDPALYGRVSSSVRVGDIKASAFGGYKSGFWRHFQFKGQGRYSLHATLGVGDVVFSHLGTALN